MSAEVTGLLQGIGRAAEHGNCKKLVQQKCSKKSGFCGQRERSGREDGIRELHVELEGSLHITRVTGAYDS